MVILKTLVGNLSANVNEITFTDAIINSNSIIEVYYNSNDVYTVETWQRENTIGIVTSDHNFPISVKVLINNVVAFEPYDDTSLVNRIDGLDERMGDAEDAISALAGRVGDAEDDIDALETSMSGKQDALIAGDNITIENNVISASGGGEVIYSTTERVVGTWIDGKPLYERTYYIPNPTNGGYVDHGISNIGVGIVYNVTANRNGNIWMCPVDYNGPQDWFSCMFSRGGQIYTLWATAITIKEVYVTFRYTKTTD